MAYDYNKYIRNYNKENIKTISFKLNRKTDSKIIEFLEGKNKSQIIKDLIRKEIE